MRYVYGLAGALLLGGAAATLTVGPVGAQTATLVCVNTGCPLARTRVAPTTHCAVTHGPFPPGGTNGQPATTYGAT